MSIASSPQSDDLPGSHGGKRDQQKRVHREAILAAGEHVLGADLRRCVAVDRIAAEAGLAKGTVYNYFADKAALVEAVTQRVEARVVERIERAMWGLPNAAARLAAAIYVMLGTAAQFPEEAVILERRIGAAGNDQSLIGALMLAELGNNEFDRLTDAVARRAALTLLLSAVGLAMREVICRDSGWAQRRVRR
jgi:AcrR family transcriptional regulator